MNNEKNLKPFTSENAAEMGSKGGKKSAEIRARKKTMREQFDLLLSKKAKLNEMKNGEELKLQLKLLGIEPADVDNQMLLIASMFQTAVKQGKNQVPAFLAIRDTVGDKPKEKIELSKEIDDSIKEIENYLCNKK